MFKQINILEIREYNKSTLKKEFRDRVSNVERILITEKINEEKTTRKRVCKKPLKENTN